MWDEMADIIGSINVGGFIMAKEVLYFTGIHNTLAILIPKKIGKGYLKSPFGGHHCNKYYFQFLNLGIDYVGNCFDIDGYLSIGFGLNPVDNEYREAIDNIIKGIVSVFLQCEGYREIDSETFFSLI